VQYIEVIEDAVQSALMSALETWMIKGLPDNRSAWLFKVAHNNLMGEMRQNLGRDNILKKNTEFWSDALNVEPKHRLSSELQDDMLRMLFVCCDDAIPLGSQLVLALKVLCGFNIREIALRLFISEANVYKRLNRARKRLQENPTSFGELSALEYASRLPAVNKIVYLVFTEGYLSCHAKIAIRKELCDEAIYLAKLLVANPQFQASQTYALLALMHLHIARMNARQDNAGGLLLLEEQDRSLWDQQRINTGLAWLEKSATGDVFSRYHGEAGIAAEHCLAPSFNQTRWDTIVQYYCMLEQSAPSAIHRLNRAVAVAQWKGPAAGLAIVENFEPPTWLVGSYLWSAVLADLHRRIGNVSKAKAYREEALKSAPTPAVKMLLQKRLKINKSA
jgi:RNA polymerase sigma-70 factor (ECF subfamily)